MGLVCVVVYANWNFGRSAQRVSVDRVRNGDCSCRCVCPSISSGPLPTLQTILSKEDAPSFLESVLFGSRPQPYPLINGVSGLPLPPARSGPPFPQSGATAQW